MLLIEAVLDHNGEKIYFPYEKIECFGPSQNASARPSQRYWLVAAGEQYTLRGTVDDVLRQIPEQL